jgi:hypothetical protein
MPVIRKASLDAHAAARDAKENDVACFAARAAGQAVATAHVPQHAFGASYYALKAVAANSGNVKKELNWQTHRIPKRLKKPWQDWQAQRLPKKMKQMLSKTTGNHVDSDF